MYRMSYTALQKMMRPLLSTAVGARYGDLAPSSQQEAASCRPPLPAITFVFAEVAGTHSLTYKHQKSQLHALNKAIRRCMLQQIAHLPGGDGYMCRCHEPDLKYMVAFESPVRAAQWCLLVQVSQDNRAYMDAVCSVSTPASAFCTALGLPVIPPRAIRRQTSEVSHLASASRILPQHAFSMVCLC